MTRGGRSFNYGYTGIAIGWGLIALVFITFIVYYYLAIAFKRFFVEIASRSWAAILGGIVGAYFSPLLVSYKDAGYILLILIFSFPLIVQFLDSINQSLPQDEVTKTIASFVEGGLLGAIFITIITNLFPIDY